MGLPHWVSTAGAGQRYGQAQGLGQGTETGGDSRLPPIVGVVMGRGGRELALTPIFSTVESFEELRFLLADREGIVTQSPCPGVPPDSDLMGEV